MKNGQRERERERERESETRSETKAEVPASEIIVTEQQLPVRCRAMNAPLAKHIYTDAGRQTRTHG